MHAKVPKFRSKKSVRGGGQKFSCFLIRVASLGEYGAYSDMGKGGPHGHGNIWEGEKTCTNLHPIVYNMNKLGWAEPHSIFTKCFSIP